jgi:hypothetical protein
MLVAKDAHPDQDVAPATGWQRTVRDRTQEAIARAQEQVAARAQLVADLAALVEGQQPERRAADRPDPR